MSTKSKRKNYFRGQVADNAREKQKAMTGFGYLDLPKDIKVFNPDLSAKSVKLDFIPYLVTDPKHPDRNTEKNRALPGNPWYKRPFKTHRKIGAGMGDTVVCLSSINKPCPICEYRAKKIKEGADKDTTDVLKPSLRNLYIVIPLDSKKYEKEIHVFDISDYNFQKLLTDVLDEEEENEIFPDLEEGRTMKVRFNSKTIGDGKPFPEASVISFLDREDTYDESILEEVPNLDEVLKIMSYKELEAKFQDMEDTDEDDEKPRHKKSTKKPVDEDDEPDDDPDEEDDEPVKKKTSHKKECPHGFRFGVDADKKQKCDKCQIFDACLTEKERLRKLQDEEDEDEDDE